MTAAQRRYRRIETAIGATISAVLSVVFMLLIFGGRDPVAVRDWDGLIVDAFPQSLMIALMATLVPTLLTRRRVAVGAVAPLPPRDRRPRHVMVRSLMVALPIAVVATAAHVVILPLVGGAVPFATALGCKALYGALLGAVVARWAVTAALTDRFTPGHDGTAAATDRRDA
ncbi:hypothetical protein [Sphingomonas montana]|uniref:hypothetical protein n=1 Tax=Sphingomonas montana TaxID=1843236 RepID=UPI00096F386E|nr:hypothetical protein [Sphingomonas montana]